MADGKTKILVVDDDARLRDLLNRYLNEQGFAVRVVSDATEMNRQLARERYDLMILDLMLPGEDGLSICRRLRGGGEKMPIIMLTAKGDEVDRIVGLEIGADDYLAKPFAFEVLLARLRALARRVPATPALLLQVADLVVDPAKHTVARAGAAIGLSAREFRLLHFLVRRANQIVPRETLIEAVWGYDSSIESNTLDAFIHLLRAKIDAPPQDKLIHTVRGLGYCIKAPESK